MKCKRCARLQVELAKLHRVASEHKARANSLRKSKQRERKRYERQIEQLVRMLNGEE